MKDISRRETLGLGAALGASLAAAGEAGAADMAGAPPQTVDGAGFSLESDLERAVLVNKLHGGEGQVKVRRFAFAGAALPANFVSFDIPPAASEGVHVHGIGLQTGPYDEYYYVIAGQGRMEVDGQMVEVKAGDHIHAPMGVHHGIANTHDTQNLKVLITFITREA